MKKTFNLEHLVSVEVISKRPSVFINWHQRIIKNWLGKVVRVESGFINATDVFRTRLYTQTEIEAEGYLVENNNVYQAPRVVLIFVNQDSYTKKFDTNAAATEWAAKFEDKLKDSYWYEDN
jgi:hypothetical protein